MDDKAFKYVIVSPVQTSGGSIALHALCDQLNSLGCDARVFYMKNFHYLTTPKIIYWMKWFLFFITDCVKRAAAKLMDENLLINHQAFNGYVDLSVEGCPRKILPFIDKNTVVIYPEIMQGNPLGARLVVRWFLYKYPWKQLEGSFADSDLFFAYQDRFNDYDLNPSCRILYCSYYDLNKYKRTNYGPRSGSCYIVRKGKDRLDLPKNFDGPVIDRLSEKEKVSLFNKCERCISYDKDTGYSDIAAICGCDSIVMLEDGDKPRIDNGIAYSFEEDELNRARRTVELKLEDLKARYSTSRKSVASFVETVNEEFNAG